MTHQRHPYSDRELETLLRAERLAITRRVVALKHYIREMVGQLEALETRLAAIEAEEYLATTRQGVNR